MTKNRFSLLVGLATLVLAGCCVGETSISLAAVSGPPGAKLRISGSGFAPHVATDVYFDTQNVAAVTTDAAGTFSGIVFQAPASAMPGRHWISAVERSSRIGSQVSFTVQSDWTEFHKQNMMRWNGAENVLGVSNVKNLEVKWSYIPTVEGFDSPIVANGVVYAGSSAGNLYAWDAISGAVLWTYTAAAGIYTAPAVANGVVYVGSDDSNVYALDADTGSLLWIYTTGGWVESAPSIVNGVVYIQSTDGNLYALDANTGEKLWSFATGTQSCYHYCSPAVANGLVFIGTKANNFYAVNATTGALQWSYTAAASFDVSPAVANGVVYIGSIDGVLHALKATTGAQLWSYKVSSYLTSPAIANGIVYFGGYGTKEYAVSTTTHKLVWSHALCTTCTEGETDAIVANGVVYFSKDKFYALNAKTGAKLWSYASHALEAVVVNGMLYTSVEGGIYAFGLPGDSSAADTGVPAIEGLLPNFKLRVSGSAPK